MGLLSRSYQCLRRSFSSRGDHSRSRSRDNPGLQAPDGNVEISGHGSRPPAPPPPPARAGRRSRFPPPTETLEHIFTQGTKETVKASSLYAHLPLRPECGLCGVAFGPEEHCLALRQSSSEGQPISSSSNSSGFEAQFTDRTSLMARCRLPGCLHCLRTPEPATLHLDCFELFKQECTSEDKLYRLWLEAVWRYPMPYGRPLVLRNRLPTASPEAIRRVGIMCDLPQLASLPLEIVDIIWQYAQPELIDRYSFIVYLARELSQPMPEYSSSGPLVYLSAWERGKPPRESPRISLGFVVRLTIDSRGIQKLEKLPGIPAYQSQRSDTELFVVQKDDTLSKLYVQQKKGRLRITAPPDNSADPRSVFWYWDTPTPPDWDECKLYLQYPIRGQFHTIPLSRITGITFFVSNYSTYGIHAHTATDPSAYRTWERLSERYKPYVLWAYMPISAKDEILAFGVRTPGTRDRPIGFRSQPCFLFRLKLAGDVAVGHYHHYGSTADFFDATSPESILIHDVPDILSVFTLAIYPRPPPGERPARFDRAPTHPNIQLITSRYLSWARLEAVARVDVFYEPGTEICRGILVYYANGAQRALGQCRVHVDAFKTWVKPSCICRRDFRFPQPTSNISAQVVSVECAHDLSHRHSEPGWKCSQLRGTLAFQFSAGQSILHLLQ